MFWVFAISVHRGTTLTFAGISTCSVSGSFRAILGGKSNAETLLSIALVPKMAPKARGKDYVHTVFTGTHL